MFCVAIALLSLLIFNWTGEADLRQFDMKGGHTILKILNVCFYLIIIIN